MFDSYDKLSEKYVRKLMKRIATENQLCYALEEDTQQLDISSVTLATVCMMVNECMGRANRVHVQN